MRNGELLIVNKVVGNSYSHSDNNKTSSEAFYFASESTFCATQVFFVHYSLATLMTN